MQCLRWCCAWVVMSLVGATGVGAAQPAEFGFSKVEITPDEPLRLSGYGNRTQPSEGVAQRIWVRTMVLRDDEGKLAALVAVDTIGFPGVLTTAIARRLDEQHGIPRERFVQTSTHSHTTPHLSDGLTNIFSEPLTPEQETATRRYTQLVADRVVASVGEAIEDLKPGRMLRGEGRAGFAANRRVLTDGRWTGFGVTPGGAVDHSLPVLQVVDSDGKLRGLVFNYACHCTTLGGDFNQVCGDWAGYASEYLEETNPGIVALCTIGCGADANPEPRGALTMAEAHGREAALAVQATIQQPLSEVAGPLVASFGYAGLPIDRPTTDQLRERLQDSSAQTRRHAQTMLDIHARMGRLPETYPMPIQTWTFGSDLTMVFLSGEVVVDYAHRLKKEIEAGYVWVNGYANDVFGYLPSERVRQEGGYEVDRSQIYYNHPGPWLPGTEEIVIGRVHDILQKPQSEGALAPDAALNSFRLPEGLEIELVASEPLIADPVAFDFGPDGRLWVAEMGDYPRGVDDSGAPGGKIRVLEDTDGDGRFDTSQVFLDGIAYPTGVMPWRDGILVTSAPDVLLARDTNGDGRADETQVLYTGFVLSNPQHRINGFAYGLDNWIYLGSGASNDTIRSEKTGATVNMSGRDLRIRPDDGLLEAVAGRTQYGRSRDDWGNWFGNTNSHPLYHYVISDHYLRRNPHVAAPDPKAELILPSPAPPVFPASRTVDRFNDLHAANRFTSACAPIVFRDASLPELYGHALVCEPVHNLVHRAVLTPDGATFEGSRAPQEQQSEFLASTDVWSRPTRLATGPDGALWVADMYRHVIEHPQWIPEEWQKRLNIRAGEDRGRIYRVYRRGTRPGALPNLAALSSNELVERLAGENGWQRDTAQRLLIERGDRETLPHLVRLALEGPTPLARIHALWTLDALQELSPNVLMDVLADADPRVQEQAILAAEAQLKSSSDLGRAVAALADHPELRVRLQAALSLGEWPEPEAAAALGRLAARDGGDRWIRAAVLSSARPHAGSILKAVLSDAKTAPAHPLLVQDLIATALGEQGEQVLPSVVAAIASAPGAAVEPWQLAAGDSVLTALERRGLALPELRKRGTHEVEGVLAGLERLIDAARLVADDQAADLSAREAGVRLLGRGSAQRQEDRSRLAGFLTPQTAPVLQRAAVATLAATREPDTPARLLETWRSYSPALQGEVLGVLISRQEWLPSLLDAMERGVVQPAELPAAIRTQLLSHKSSDVARRAADLLAGSGEGSRQSVLDAHAGVVGMKGSWLRGAEVFSRRCATCHRYRELGQELGPNLAALQDRSPQFLLESILDPNRAVEQKYRDYTAATVDGRLVTGMVLEEAASSVTLVRPTGAREVILRQDLEEFASSGRSFMPEGLERDLSPQDLADVVAYLQTQTRESASQSLTASEAELSPVRISEGAERVRAQTWLGEREVAVGLAGSSSELAWMASTGRTSSDGSASHRFLFPVTFAGAAGGDASWALRAGNVATLQMPVPQGDGSWSDPESGAVAHYLAVTADGDHSSGVLIVELPAHALGPGEETQFVVEPPPISAGRLGIMELSADAGH